MNLNSHNNFMDEVAYHRQCVRKAKRLRNICLAQTRRMYRWQRRHVALLDPPPFMLCWWMMVEDLHECATTLEDNNAPFLALLRHYRERAQIQFKL